MKKINSDEPNYIHLNRRLMAAVGRGNVRRAKDLLALGADPTDRGNKVIHVAARLGNVAMLEMFHSCGVALTDLNESALAAAAYHNQVAAVKYLLGLPGITAGELDMACHLSICDRLNWKPLSVLLAAGGELNENDLAHAAAAANSVQCLHTLERLGCKLAPLADKIIFHATCHNYRRVLKYALENWAFNKTEVDSCLTIAGCSRNLSIFKMLVKHGTQSPVSYLEIFHTLVRDGARKNAILLLPYLRFEDLADADLRSIISVSQRQFLAHYLQRGLPLDRIKLTPELAKKFIRYVQPQTLLPPQNGGQLSPQTISERLRFGRHVVSEAGTLSPQWQSRGALWLTKLLLAKNKLFVG